MTSSDDWRRQGQEKYLKGKVLTWKKYSGHREHDHCEFCSAKFMEIEGPDTLNEGYATDDNYRWICKKCFDDFCEEFEWTTT